MSTLRIAEPECLCWKHEIFVRLSQILEGVRPMNRLIVASAALVMISSSANAQAVKLRGSAADAFVAKYFPNAAVPGRIKGQFTYTSKSGAKGSGLAKCDIPAMGARSEGAVSLCKVLY
jgi:hypothetical protein